MTHLDIENLASDYLEGALDASRRQAVEAHLSGCGPCREVIADIRHALELCRSAEDVEPAPWLVSKILLATVGERKPTWREQIADWFRPVVQPRLAYPIAMTVFAFSIIVNAAGLNLRHLRFEDLNPRTWFSRANRSGHLMAARVEKFCYDLRFIIELESRLRQIRGQSQDHEDVAPKPGSPTGGSSEGQPPGGTQLAFVAVPLVIASVSEKSVSSPVRQKGPSREGRSLIP